MTPTQCPECWHAFHEPGPCRVSPGEPCYCGGREPIPVTPTPDPAASMMLPTEMLRTLWPPNGDLNPGGSPRFDAVYDSLRAGEPMREPITVRLDDWTVIDGCHRLRSARLIGIEWVPVRVWTGVKWLPEGDKP